MIYDTVSNKNTRDTQYNSKGYGGVTYADIARYLGRPRAVRAVGTAVGKNPNVPKVPCHRVVRSNGYVGSYIYGTERKSALLKSEGIKIKNNKIDLKEYRYSLK